jgi:hypothetical protein
MVSGMTILVAHDNTGNATPGMFAHAAAGPLVAVSVEQGVRSSLL